MKPYGYVHKDGEGLFIYGEHQFQNAMDAELVPVYLHPKEWVGLTIQEIAACCRESTTTQLSFYNAIEAKLKELNAQRTWVDLTDEEMLECNMDGDWTTDRETAKLNVQAKLKEKNT